jgi:hypothetical protein
VSSLGVKQPSTTTPQPLHPLNPRGRKTNRSARAEASRGRGGLGAYGLGAALTARAAVRSAPMLVTLTFCLLAVGFQHLDPVSFLLLFRSVLVSSRVLSAVPAADAVRGCRRAAWQEVAELRAAVKEQQVREGERLLG